MTEETGESQQKSSRRREFISLGVLALIVVGGWAGLITALGTSTPFFVVSSGSMIPALKVGDVIVIKGGGEVKSLQAGDIIVFKNPLNPERVIVHRVFRIVNTDDGGGVITKGDNNPTQDNWLVRPTHFLGKVLLTVPYIGFAAIWLSPPLNYVIMIAIISFVVAIEFRPKRKKSDGELPAVQ
ncbi:MAG: signal peptidase I [Thaumarchaeota archaeon]|nr:signal peptidase I [Nitrososphaerota archaeon]